MRRKHATMTEHLVMVRDPSKAICGEWMDGVTATGRLRFGFFARMHRCSECRRIAWDEPASAPRHRAEVA